MVIHSISIDRQQIEMHPPDTSSLENILKFLVEKAAKMNDIHLMNLTIGGYDFDSRELYEIPEVCRWARVTFKHLPGIWFFLTTDCQIRFIGWLCGPFKKEDVYTTSFQDQFEQQSLDVIAAGLVNGIQMLKWYNASKQLIELYRDYHESK